MHARSRLREEQGRGRSSEDRANGWMPDDSSSRSSLEAAAAQLVSWPCTPRMCDATPGGSMSSVSSLGLFRSLSAAPNGGATGLLCSGSMICYFTLLAQGAQIEVTQRACHPEYLWGSEPVPHVQSAYSMCSVAAYFVHILTQRVEL